MALTLLQPILAQAEAQLQGVVAQEVVFQLTEQHIVLQLAVIHFLTVVQQELGTLMQVVLAAAVVPNLKVVAAVATTVEMLFPQILMMQHYLQLQDHTITEPINQILPVPIQETAQFQLPVM